MILNITVKEKSKTLFVCVNYQLNHNLLTIQNSLTNVDLIVYQSCLAGKSFGIIVKSGEKSNFAWDYPEKDKKIMITPIDANLMIKSKCFDFECNSESTLIDMKSNQETPIIGEVYLEENGRVIHFYTKISDKRLSIMNNDTCIKKTIRRNINKIGLSVIIGKHKQRCEVFYISMDKFRFEYDSTEVSELLIVKIKSLGVDNNMRRNCAYPILLRSQEDDSLKLNDFIEITARIRRNFDSSCKKVMVLIIIIID